VDTIGQQKLWTFLAGANKAVVANCTQIRQGGGHRINDYMELVRKLAELQFMNRDYVLLYRGQNADHHNAKGNTTLKPSLLRASNGKNPNQATLVSRFDVLKKAETLLIDEYQQRSLLGKDRLKRQQILRWSILQHYEVCATPLLDVTNSLRIAASFASDGAGSEAFIFVIGVPNLSGAITASAEAGLQIVRLSSVCPPTALRPHIQEGYLLGEYPEMTGYDQKQYYANFEIDFGRRLVAKFRFNPRSFWKKRLFPKVERSVLYPNKNDPLFALAESIRSAL